MSATMSLKCKTPFFCFHVQMKAGILANMCSPTSQRFPFYPWEAFILKKLVNSIEKVHIFIISL